MYDNDEFLTKTNDFAIQLHVTPADSAEYHELSYDEYLDNLDAKGMTHDQSYALLTKLIEASEYSE